MIRKLLLTAAALMAFHYPIAALAYDDEITHPGLTKVAVSESNLNNYLKDNLGIIEGLAKQYSGKTILKLMEDGATNEDLAVRALNHFWDPTRNLGLDDKGYAVFFGIFPVPYLSFTGLGNLDWAMGYKYNPPYDRLDEPDKCPSGDLSDSHECNDYSWKRAQDLYHEALIGTSESERDQKFAAFYEKLGRVLHLLQDMGVPAHTRNDMIGHLDFTRFTGVNPLNWGGNIYEFHVKKNDGG